MYGFVLEGIGECVRKKYGDGIWDEVAKKMNLTSSTFNPNKTYSETVVPRVIKATAEVTGKNRTEITPYKASSHFLCEP